MIKKLEISDRFDLNDIRKIREYNSERHLNMSPEKIIAETKVGAQKVLKLLNVQKPNN